MTKETTIESLAANSALQGEIKHEAKMFGRIGLRFTLNQQMVAAGAAGAILTEDKEAGTVIAKAPSGETVFRALHKGGNIWLIMYSEAFYPKP